MPRWLLVPLTALGTLSVSSAAVGWKAGRGLAAVEVTLVSLAKADATIAARVDTLRSEVDSLQAGRAVDGRVLRALGKLRCQEVTSERADMVDLPCQALMPHSSGGRGRPR